MALWLVVKEIFLQLLSLPKILSAPWEESQSLSLVIRERVSIMELLCCSFERDNRSGSLSHTHSKVPIVYE